MAGHPQIYKEKGKTYVADTCVSLVEAEKAGLVKTEILARGSYPGQRLQKGELKGVCSVGYWNAQRDQRWGLDFHRNEGIEFTYLESGSLPFTIHNQIFTLKPGDLTITRPWQLHRLGDPNVHASKLHWLIFDVGVRRPNQKWTWPDWIVITKDDINQLTEFLRHNETEVFKATKKIKNCFIQIGNIISDGSNDNKISFLKVYINELLVLILDMLKQSRVTLNPALSGSRRTVELFFDHLRQDISNLAYPWTVKEMAKQCGLGATYFVHHCKQLTNATPAQYLNQLRIEAAVQMLTEEPEKKIIDIALDCGFNTSQYFATVFQKVKGCSPKDFRSHEQI